MSIDYNLDSGDIGEVIDIRMSEYLPGPKQLIDFKFIYERKQSEGDSIIQNYHNPTTEAIVKQMLVELRDRKIIDPEPYDILIDELREIPTAKK